MCETYFVPRYGPTRIRGHSSDRETTPFSWSVWTFGLRLFGRSDPNPPALKVNISRTESLVKFLSGIVL